MKKLLFLTLCVLCLPSLLNAWYEKSEQTVRYNPKTGNISEVKYADEYDRQEAEKGQGRGMHSYR